LIASYRAMTHTNNSQTVHTCQSETQSVCTIMSDPWPVLEARLVFKAQLVFND